MTRRVCAAMYTAAQADTEGFIQSHFKLSRSQPIDLLAAGFEKILLQAPGVDVDVVAVASNFQREGVVPDVLLRAATFAASDFL